MRFLKKNNNVASKRKLKKAKVGPVEFEWEQLMADPNADTEFIKKQIDGWFFEIEHEQFLDVRDCKKDLDAFISAMRRYGHVTRLDDEYKNKYLEILTFQKRNWGGNTLFR